MSSLPSSSSSSPMPDNRRHDHLAEGPRDAPSFDVKVAARVRLPSQAEKKARYKCCVEVQRSSSVIINGSRSFPLDYAAGQDVSQKVLYNNVAKELADDWLHGTDVALCAYGQTGTGKSFTMQGPEDKPAAEVSPPGSSSQSDDLQGIASRVVKHTFEFFGAQDVNEAVEYELKCSVFQIYLDKPEDLLKEEEPEGIARTCPDVSLGVFLKDMTRKVAYTADDALDALRRGKAKCSRGKTLMNTQSTRSHWVFLLTLLTTRRDFAGNETTHTSLFHLVDLAGDESIIAAPRRTKQHTEAKDITESLRYLREAIRNLIARNKYIQPNFRLHKITMLLKDTLEHGKFTLLGTLSPAELSIEDSLKTCDFLMQAKAINEISHPMKAKVGKQAAQVEASNRLQNEVASLNGGAALLAGPALRAQPAPGALGPGLEWSVIFASAFAQMQNHGSVRDVTMDELCHFLLLPVPLPPPCTWAVKLKEKDAAMEGMGQKLKEKELGMAGMDQELKKKDSELVGIRQELERRAKQEAENARVAPAVLATRDENVIAKPIVWVKMHPGQVMDPFDNTKTVFRHYHKCSIDGCPARKHVDKPKGFKRGDIVDPRRITFEGDHNHPYLKSDQCL